MFHQRETVHYHEPRHHVRMIYCDAERNERPAVVAHDGDLLVAKVPHEQDHVIGHCPLGGLSVLGRVAGKRRLSVAAQVRVDDEERAGEERRHSVPRRMRTRMAME